jgi:ribosome-binding protein aMBF1 (putative translation factor)
MENTLDKPMHQDWDTVMWRKNAPKTGAEAKRMGLPTESVRRRPCGGAMRKVAETEIGDIKRWGKKLGAAVARARAAKQLSQVALARQLNVKPAVIVACESGKGKADAVLLHRMRRILGPLDKQ